MSTVIAVTAFLLLALACVTTLAWATSRPAKRQPDKGAAAAAGIAVAMAAAVDRCEWCSNRYCADPAKCTCVTTCGRLSCGAGSYTRQQAIAPCPCCTADPLHSDDCNCRDDCGVTQCQAADPGDGITCDISGLEEWLRDGGGRG